MRRRTLLAGSIGLLASSCADGIRVAPAAPSASLPALAANPVQGWPEAVRRAPPEVREAYAFAAANEMTLRWIPCYCGCGAQGHRDNFDCYVQQVRPNGWLVLDAHGLGCEVCVGITRDVMGISGR